MSTVDTSVIISTYNQPLWLEKVLWSYNAQSFTNFEVLIADDGSTQETKNLILRMQNEVTYPLQHIWHKDNGFQKTTILNKAILASKGAYLVFTDGDCIARNDFLKKHIESREKDYFLSGGYFKLPLTISQKISKQDIESQNCFNIKWLKIHGLKSSYKNRKITAKGFFEKIFNFITPTTPSWNGHNASGWKVDILKINGFDQRMQYGGEDRELGERLINSGIKAKQIRYSAICLHLDHKRGYVKPEMIAKNASIRKVTKAQKVTFTPYGIKK